MLNTHTDKGRANISSIVYSSILHHLGIVEAFPLFLSHSDPIDGQICSSAIDLSIYSRRDNGCGV